MSSRCNFPSFSFGLPSFPPSLPSFPLPALPTFSLAFSLSCPLDAIFPFLVAMGVLYEVLSRDLSI